MQLQFSLMGTGHRFTLDETMIESSACYFHLSSGRFSLQAPEVGCDALCFSWRYPGLVVVNQLREQACTVDGKLLSPGEHYEMVNDCSRVQVGPHQLKVVLLSTNAVGDLSSAQLPAAVTWPDEKNCGDLPEIDTLLPHAGYYSSYLKDAVSLQTDDDEVDVLKALQYEYKRYLIWGDQGDTRYSDSGDPFALRLPAQNAYFERVVEEVKEKTITECILDNGRLIEEVLAELMELNEIEIREEDQVDLLVALAPDNISKRKQHTISRLAFQDLYRLGLESQI